MGHKLHAVIGQKHIMTSFANRWIGTNLISLPQNFAFVPMTSALFDDMDELAHIIGPDTFDGFGRLSAGVEWVLGRFSENGAIGCIETD